MNCRKSGPIKGTKTPRYPEHTQVGLQFTDAMFSKIARKAFDKDLSFTAYVHALLELGMKLEAAIETKRQATELKEAA